MAPQLDEVSIRPARADDADDIARVDIASWQGAYSEILPGSYLSSLDPEDRAALWRDAVAAEGTRILVAETGGSTVGFTSVGPSRDEDAEDGDLEIYAIYLHPRAWGSGVARDLMRQVLGDVPSGASVTLWILEENERAQHFYRRHGFAPDGTERIDEIGGKPMTQLRYRR
ncbi:GNAT family N-acetyltransferase [Myceligenerans pegani]|uniref:GNAT family N-acetyltransferase n=1 Tax=Myceligenerans pegani TaxID=2776917 RepID=A0ABR9N3A6_9MICO|nr:GNAT family N-acetyltransferase [Myceligenerans sp. TRM 65318]MBE1878131.1 GNAT family N-acetyltransferase [Myceligenerans sp. TRM 65318]MBE3020402.1 GNAT family N-acetyltransferase [Myceligenerans sp. TRM 65318]